MYQSYPLGHIPTINKENVGTFLAVVGQMVPQVAQINVGLRDVFSRQLYGPKIDEGVVFVVI